MANMSNLEHFFCLLNGELGHNTKRNNNLSTITLEDHEASISEFDSPLL